MINRILIRTKVVQNLYSYVLTPPDTLARALKDFDNCLEKSYEMYQYLMSLPVELTHIQEIRLDEAGNKYLPLKEEMNPNMKFVNNGLVKALAENEQLKQFASDHTLNWNDDPIVQGLMLDKILKNDLYKEYMADQ